MSRINMRDTADEIAKKIRKAKTDMDPLPGPDALENERPSAEFRAARPEAANLITLVRLNRSEPAAVIAEFEGQEFRAFKDAMAEATDP